MLSTIITIVLSVILFLVFLFAVYAVYISRHHGSLQKLGFVGPKYKRFGGNFASDDPNKSMHDLWIEQYQEFKHHKVFATYAGPFPSLTVTDLDIIKDIIGKYANNFSSRRGYFKAAAPEEFSLVSMEGEHWKRVRKNTSPLFSTNNLKKTSSLFEKKAKDFVNAIKEKQESGEAVNLKDLLSAFLLDGMVNAVYSKDIDSFKDPSNKFFQSAKQAASSFLKTLGLCFMFPFLETLIPFLRNLVFQKRGVRGFFLVDSYYQTVKERQKSPEPSSHNDYLQIVLDQDQQKHVDTEGLAEDDVMLHASRKRETLNDQEKMGAVMALIAGGFDNGSTTAALVLSMIANQPSVLKKVQTEIDEKLKGEFPNYENCQSLTYLEMVINETHRMYPVGSVLERICGETTTIQGITFPKGVCVAIPNYAIFNDPDIWPQPKKFDPERFTPENRAARHPCAFMPFGAGPRNCVGMRLAQYQVRLALATVLQNFSPAPCDKTVFPIVTQKFSLIPADGLWLKFERRNKTVS